MNVKKVQRLANLLERMWPKLAVLTIVVGLVHTWIARMYIHELQSSIRTLQAVCIDGGGK